jgi:hypothetical protein
LTKKNRFKVILLDVGLGKRNACPESIAAFRQKTNTHKPKKLYQIQAKKSSIFLGGRYGMETFRNKNLTASVGVDTSRICKKVFFITKLSSILGKR